MIEVVVGDLAEIQAELALLESLATQETSEESGEISPLAHEPA